MRTARKARDAERLDTRAEGEKALEELKAHGMQINQVSAEETQRMREKAQPAIQSVIDNVGKPLFDQVQAEIQKAPQ